MTNITETEQAISKLLDRTEELIHLNKLDEAENFLAEILKYKPDELNVPFQRGQILMKKEEYQKALEQFLYVHERLPDFFSNLNNIGAAYHKLAKCHEAAIFYKKALAIRSDVNFVWASLAGTYVRRGLLDEAIVNFRRSLEIQYNRDTHSDLLLTMLYAESVTPEDLAAEARKFGDIMAHSVVVNTEFSNDKTKNRKLRIGYISPDFRDHPVPYFLEPLLKNHNKENFEVYVYSSTFHDNPIMERMKTTVDFWRDIRKLSHEKSCALICEDAIDILIDPTGHTAYNNLEVIAQRAAPIQVSWLGYPASTGVQTMDYRITDAYAEPPGMTEHLNSETLWRLPHMFCCYQAHENSPDVIDHPPFEDNGFITFGCFNNFIKVRDPVLACWAQILEKLPTARLLLEIDGLDDPIFSDSVDARLRAQNLPLDRVIIEKRKRSNQFVLYNKIDIALDPFPCGGGTTSMDTLWMGVPFVTLAGKHFGSRMGVTVLSNAGLPELIAQNREEYIKIAVDLANDRDRLKKIRHNLREKVAASPTMDAKSFAHDMENAYRAMWHKYCDA